jgi:hypothetical protein
VLQAKLADFMEKIMKKGCKTPKKGEKPMPPWMPKKGKKA